MTKLAALAADLAVLAATDGRAEGLVFVPGQGWRAFWGETVPRLLDQQPIPPPPARAYDAAPRKPHYPRAPSHQRPPLRPVARAPIPIEPDEATPEAAPAPPCRNRVRGQR